MTGEELEQTMLNTLWGRDKGGDGLTVLFPDSWWLDFHIPEYIVWKDFWLL
jgi:hypothetical protein